MSNLYICKNLCKDTKTAKKSEMLRQIFIIDQHSSCKKREIEPFIAVLAGVI